MPRIVQQRGHPSAFGESGVRQRKEIGMTKKLMWLIAATLLLIGFVLYLRQPGDNLNVTPDARREIDKAKRR